MNKTCANRMPEGKILTDRSGFSLVEMLIACAVLILAFEHAVGALSVNSKLSGHQTKLAGAMHVGRSVMEGLLMASSADPRLAAGAHVEMYDSDSSPVTVGTGEYTARWTVVHDAPFTSIQSLRLEISWQEAGVQRSVDFVSYRN